MKFPKLKDINWNEWEECSREEYYNDELNFRDSMRIHLFEHEIYLKRI
ncbi:MAG: hypothetical protein IIA87_03580 [Nanoarchaeota archaeon]|nr:hypothetical protein [Nanoarchaeota archaeon]